ncbi:methyl-accepting chemotaxis protein [uncultured Cohaesibacter sp.]|uniref:HAMP domain-containing methyl-accepting chemotaxis protein n=1 Tax=uncultured Cohaesibacter sp. TaxID=1002546 RepID=UPI0029C6823C|nr:methyl-accepting chemotaxis protein [uncultured Cohaesibacter sp.]
MSQLTIDGPERTKEDVSHKRSFSPSASLRLKIGPKIYLGFSIVLMLLIGLGIYSLLEMRSINDRFVTMADMESDAELIAEIQSTVVETQLAARDFMFTFKEESRQDFKKHLVNLEELVGQAHQVIQNPERVDLLNRVTTQIGDYKQGFSEVEALLDRRNHIVNESLLTKGASLRNWLTQIREGAFAAGDYESASQAGIAQELFLLARLYVMKYLDDNDQANADRTMSELETLKKALGNLDKSIENPDRRKLLAEISATVPLYEADFKEVHGIIHQRNSIRDKVLDANAEQMAVDTAAIDASAKKDTAALKAGMSASLDQAMNSLLIIASAALVVGLLAAFTIARSITRPLTAMTRIMGKLAQSDYSVDIPGMERTDEIGLMAKAVEVFKKNGIHAREMEAEQAASKEQAEKEKHDAMMQMADDFDSHVGSIVDAVSSASAELSATAKSMSDVSVETSNQATAASAASEQTSSNVQTVATATQEMTTTIDGINEQISQASASSREAVHKVSATSHQMQILAETADKIGAVVEMISGIAEQTNLLALNATIESARAGVAGKGFAVVAAEVKELAGQTAKATDEIAHQIASVQAATREASHSMEDVSRVIQHVDEISAAIAEAMEQQNAATREIAGSVHQAAQGTQLVNDNVRAVSDASQATGAAANQVMASAEELSQQASLLKSEVAKFISEVRAS